MRLTAIKLAGFKSFVDPTTLTLDANLTGIVGPNGCGKSNVIDAVRWVTGESSAKQLRGEALEDVIFNGSRGRKPVGRVAVELKFDNSAGKLGGQYARFSEIAIRRELTRDGSSRFFINGSKARRRDVVDLFLGTGLGGRNNYAVIEQGAVNRLVEAKPDELRRVLEETAGISRYKERRRETENRIRHTRENLDRLNDLIGEVTQRLDVLKRQARNAERYKALKQDERRLRAELLALRWRAFDGDVHKAQEQLEQHEQALAAAVSGQRQAQQARAEHNRAQQAAAAACQQHQTAFYDAQAEATRIAQALEHARQLQAMRQREYEQLASRQAELAARESEDCRALEQTAQAMAETEAGLAARQATRDQLRNVLDATDVGIEQAEQRWQVHNNREQSPVAQLEAERTQRGYLCERIEQIQATHGKRETEAAALAGDNDAVDLQALEKQVQALTAQVARDEQYSHELTDQRTRLDDDRNQLQGRVDTTRTQLAEKQARLAAQKTMQQAALREDDSGVREWLAEQGHGDAQSVARRVEAPAAWQTAVEAALVQWLAGFAVEALPAQDMPWPAEALTLVENGALESAATALPDLGGLPCLASRVSAPPAVMAAAGRIFVADTVGAALAARAQLACDQFIVTTDGACIGPAMLRTPAGDNSGRGVLEREQNIKALAAECEVDSRQLDTLGAELSALEQQRQTVRDQARAVEESLAAARRDLARTQAELQGEQSRQAQRRRRAQELAEEQSRLQQQLDTDQSELTALDARIDTLREQAEAHVRERDAAQDALAEARRARNTAWQQFDEAEAGVRQLEQERTAARSRHDSLTLRLEDVRTTKAQVDERLAAFTVQTETDGIEPAPSQDDHEQASARRQAAESALRRARETLQTAEKQSEDAARAVMLADNAVNEARETMQQARIAVETAGARRGGLVEQLDELGADVDSLLATLDAQATVDAWHGRIETVERKIARLGAINLAAIEEHDAEAEREQYLNAQHADLSSALETLEAAIAKIDRETRTRFKATFIQVNQRFGAMFPTLFGGGQASLELTEDDLLSTGVRVMARPPGKRNATIHMLSGGEKAMTALALLFALFELNPAPFCMLDEIDAPLDDANVARFCELVRSMSDTIQFVVITHNKQTMELTEQLHGVTMLEPGVSRLVSVNIDEALDMAG